MQVSRISAPVHPPMSPVPTHRVPFHVSVPVFVPSSHVSTVDTGISQQQTSTPSGQQHGSTMGESSFRSQLNMGNLFLS